MLPFYLRKKLWVTRGTLALQEVLQGLILNSIVFLPGPILNPCFSAMFQFYKWTMTNLLLVLTVLGVFMGAVIGFAGNDLLR